jgi:DNA-binding MarR family transcriptional regulator
MNPIHKIDDCGACTMSPHDINQARMNELSDADYAALADFRHALRRFLEFSENAAAAEGLTPQQHQALLVIRGSAGSRASVGRLAERLRVKHNTAVELGQRLEAAGLIERQVSAEDRRSVLLTLTPLGSRKLETLSLIHRRELSQLSPEILGLFQSLGATTP